MKISPKILLIGALAAFLAIGCTTRRVYDSPSDTAETQGAININTAAASELERLPRIGSKTAENIVRFRTDHGPFRRVEELMQVKGISENKFLEIRQYLRTE